MSGMDIEIPDAEDAACDLDGVKITLARKGYYGAAEMVDSAARRIRADAEEIARLTAKVEELEKDRERLDWLQGGGMKPGGIHLYGTDIRSQIDAARAQEPADGPL